MTPADESAEWVDNAADPGRPGRAWTELWQARELVGFFALRDFRLRYKQAALGVAWVVLQPITAVAAFTFVFDRLAGIESQGVPYPLFALTGLVTWSYFASTVSRASSVLVGDSSLITKVYFPRMAAPVGALLPPLADLGVSLVLVVLLMVHFRVAPTAALLAAPLWIALLLCVALGVSLWLAALNVRYRDVQSLVTPLLQLWLFLSPVTYPSSLVTGWARFVYALNPMTGAIDLGRWTLVGAPWPGWPLAVSVTSTAVLLVAGVRYFQRAERSFADVI